jgi:hypothetical protein
VNGSSRLGVEGIIEDGPAVASLVLRTKIPLALGGRLQILQIGMPEGLREAVPQKNRSVFNAWTNLADCWPSRVEFEGQLAWYQGAAAARACFFFSRRSQRNAPPRVETMRTIVHAVYMPPSLAARERSGEAADAKFTKAVLNKV